MEKSGTLGTTNDQTLIYENHAQDARYTEKTTCPTVTSRYGTGGGNVPLTLFNVHSQDARYKQDKISSALTASMDNLTDIPIAGNKLQVRRLTPVECERLQGFPSVITFKYEEMTRDEIIAIALANKDLIVDAEMGKVYRTRGPGGKRLEEALEIKGTQSNGYLVATLRGENCRKQVRLNRVVWISVNGIPPEGMVVDHINSIKTDNRISNLQLLTKEENSTKASNDGCYLSGDSHPKAKLTVELSEKLLNEYKTGIFSYRDLAKKYGISHSRVGQIIKEHGYTQIPYRGKAKENCPDAPRYKAIGNSWAVPVVRWIGKRINKALGR